MRSSVSRMVLLLAGLVVLSSPAWAANWSWVADSAFTIPAGSKMQDRDRIKSFCMVVDNDGNLYATAGDCENNDTITNNPSGLMIVKTDNTVIHVDLSPATFTNPGPTRVDLNVPGGITRMVIGGDGKVYALQNWTEIQYDPYYRGWNHKILRINSDGSVEVIFDPWVFVNACNPPWATPPTQDDTLLAGMDVGDDGNIYWTMRGASNHWKWRFFWRYITTGPNTGLVEASPLNANSCPSDPANPNNVNQGWSNNHRLFDLIHVGKDPATQIDWFVVLDCAKNNSSMSANGIAWNQYRRGTENGTSNPGWGRDLVVTMEYDKPRQKLWVGSRGTRPSGAPANGSNVMGRWAGDTANPVLFTGTADPLQGLPLRHPADANNPNADVWHANGNDPQTSGVNNNGFYWVSAMAINPQDGSAWVSWGAQATYDYAGTYGPIGKVYRIGPEDVGPTGDEGVPLATGTSQVVALHVGEFVAYAMVCNIGADPSQPATFKLYSAGNVRGACCRATGCSDEFAGQCVGDNVEFQGAGTTCASANCTYRVCYDPFADSDGDGDVDQADFAVVQACYTGAGGTLSNSPVKCSCYNQEGDDQDVDNTDLSAWMECASGPGIPADPNCD